MLVTLPVSDQFRRRIVEGDEPSLDMLGRDEWTRQPGDQTGKKEKEVGQIVEGSQSIHPELAATLIPDSAGDISCTSSSSSTSSYIFKGYSDVEIATILETLLLSEPRSSRRSSTLGATPATLAMGMYSEVSDMDLTSLVDTIVQDESNVQSSDMDTTSVHGDRETSPIRCNSMWDLHREMTSCRTGSKSTTTPFYKHSDGTLSDMKMTSILDDLLSNSSTSILDNRSDMEMTSILDDLLSRTSESTVKDTWSDMELTSILNDMLSDNSVSIACPVSRRSSTEMISGSDMEFTSIRDDISSEGSTSTLRPLSIPHDRDTASGVEMTSESDVMSVEDYNSTLRLSPKHERSGIASQMELACICRDESGSEERSTSICYRPSPGPSSMTDSADDSGHATSSADADDEDDTDDTVKTLIFRQYSLENQFDYSLDSLSATYDRFRRPGMSTTPLSSMERQTLSSDPESGSYLADESDITIPNAGSRTVIDPDLVADLTDEIGSWSTSSFIQARDPVPWVFVKPTECHSESGRPLEAVDEPGVDLPDEIGSWSTASFLEARDPVPWVHREFPGRHS